MVITHALLVADQHVSEGFLASVSLRHQERGSELNYGDQTLQVRGFLQGEGGLLGRTEFRRSMDDNGATVDAQLSRAQRALADLARIRRRVQRERQFQQEMKWLAENARRFSGRWIALEGEHLLADGATSREVFSKVANRAEPPLVIRINGEELPFAGW